MKTTKTREQMIAEFKQFCKEHEEQIKNSLTTVEELAKDPDVIADEDCSAYFDLPEPS